MKYLFEILLEQLGRKGSRVPCQISVTDIALRSVDGHMDVTSKVIVVRTLPEGVSDLFVEGSYIDTIDICGDALKLIKCETGLDMRDLGPGSHVPL